MEGARPDAKTLAAFAAMILLAGANSIGVWYSNAELAPFWGATLRFGCAASIFLAYALVRRRPFPRGRALAGAVAYGSLGFGGAYAFAYYGIGRVAPGMAQVILALVPLLLAAVQRQEPFRVRGLLGALLAAAGIGVVFREQLALDVSLAGPSRAPRRRGVHRRVLARREALPESGPRDDQRGGDGSRIRDPPHALVPLPRAPRRATPGRHDPRDRVPRRRRLGRRVPALPLRAAPLDRERELVPVRPVPVRHAHALRVAHRRASDRSARGGRGARDRGLRTRLRARALLKRSSR